jgi:hypothetical protein
MRVQAIAWAGAAVAAIALSGAARAETPAPPSTKVAPKCFYSHDWEGWRPTDDAKSIYIRVGIHDFYRIDFSDRCPTLQAPNAHLVTKPINDLICSPIELDLKVSDPPGMSVPCIVTGITPLSPAEMAALPKKLKP